MLNISRKTINIFNTKIFSSCVLAIFLMFIFCHKLNFNTTLSIMSLVVTLGTIRLDSENQKHLVSQEPGFLLVILGCAAGCQGRKNFGHKHITHILRLSGSGFTSKSLLGVEITVTHYLHLHYAWQFMHEVLKNPKQIDIIYAAIFCQLNSQLPL